MGFNTVSILDDWGPPILGNHHLASSEPPKKSHRPALVNLLPFQMLLLKSLPQPWREREPKGARCSGFCQVSRLFRRNWNIDQAP